MTIFEMSAVWEPEQLDPIVIIIQNLYVCEEGVKNILIFMTYQGFVCYNL